MRSNGDSNQIHVKLISMGDVEVGKSCLIKKYCEGKFVSDYITTIGIDYGVKKITMRNGTVLAINIFDLSGDDDYKTIRKDFIQDALGVIFVFDVNIKATFENIQKWENEATSKGVNLSKCVVLLIGNKTDVKNRREVQTSVGREYAKSKGYQYYETSAKQGTYVAETFENLFESLHSKAIEIRSRYFY